jgi:hypothetical protein
VVEQDVGELGDIFQQSFDGTGGQLCESLIGGGEDGEGTFALECVDQVSRT